MRWATLGAAGPSGTLQDENGVLPFRPDPYSVRVVETATLLSGLLGVTGAAIPAALSSIAGTSVDPSTIKIDAFPYGYGSPATAGLWHVRGDGWSRFVKQLRHVRHWPGLSQLPPDFAATFAAEFPWRSELELWDPRVQGSLPPGLRSPVLHRLVELPGDRLVLWQEYVEQRAGPWTPGRFRRAAYLLGRWNARAMAPEVLRVTHRPAGFALRMYAERAVPFRGLEPLRSDELWHHPWLKDHGDLRAGLLEAAARIPELLDRLDGFPQALPHGDAGPQNLLVPADGSAEFAAIDLSFRSPHALGFDLGQLLVGLVHAGELAAARMPEISAVIVPAYLGGLAAEGAPTGDAPAGFAVAALLRSGFDGFRYDLLGREDEESRRLFAERVTMARFLLEQFRQVARR
ncbi:hypothetical protein [Actinoplanes sp. NPDC023714]|uniref:hypothetical protein n=1 Tax=Actinoplanes sp. NPDC023714 TaxID=3154322 RepID=UPI0033CF2252